MGISARLTAEPRAYDVGERFRARGIPVVLGGAQPSSVPHRAIHHADAVVVGEAEGVWPVLLDDVLQGGLRSFYVGHPGPFDARGRTVYQVDRWYDLSQVPVARRDLLPHRYRFDTVFASRGCPVDCDFCAVPSLYGHRTRLRPAEAVAAEIGSLRRMYYLLDDTVFGRPASYAYYLDLYQRLAHQGTTQAWTGQAHLGAVESEEGREVVRAAARCGLLYVAVGMESIHPRVLRTSGALAKTGLQVASVPAARMKEQVRFLQDLGILVSGWFTLGYDDDSLETWEQTVAFCAEAGVIPVLSPVNALPGTRLLRRLTEEGRLDWQATPTNMPHPRMTREQVLGAMARSIRDGFRWMDRMRRTIRLIQGLAQHGSPARRRVEGLFFAWFLQREMRKILALEYRNLASPRSQNALGAEER